jgi:hypothetical protein
MENASKPYTPYTDPVLRPFKDVIFPGFREGRTPKKSAHRRRPPVTNNQAKIDRGRVGNLEAAEIILADAVRYGGEESLMVRWARLVQNSAPMGVISAPAREAA